MNLTNPLTYTSDDTRVFSLNKIIPLSELHRLEDDGCPNIASDPYVAADETPTPGVRRGRWGEPLDNVWRLYSCERCGWYVGHPLTYCHKCGGRMRVMRGKSEDLQEHMRKHGYEDGGF